MLIRQGRRRDITLKLGDTVTIFGWRARDGSNFAHSREVTWADGKETDFGAARQHRRQLAGCE
jgi:hypothetical protein